MQRNVLPETANKSQTKSAQTRLLDMLAGWSRFIQQDDEPDAEDVTDAVCDLYQEAGALANTSDERVQAFVRNRVVPLLMRR